MTPAKRLMSVIICVLAASVLSSEAASSKVAVTKSREACVLTFNGKPYFIKGGGGDKYLEELVKAGGNSIRTWGTEGVDKLLDQAQELGITVTVGLWLGHERHGFNYGDSDQVSRQLEKCRKAVLKYKDHPALLMWGIGNEMEAGGDNTAIWKAVNDIAVMCKKVDPNHPTMTVIAELGNNSIKTKMIHEYCPDIDIIGINSYGGAASIAKRYKEAGGTKPYVMTEYGPLGHWEGSKSPWGAPLEMNSTDKAEFYRKTYIASIKDQPLCLGGYAFIWGNKMEVTETWFGLFLKDGSSVGAVDIMTEMWTGKTPSNRCPTISNIALDRDNGLKPGDTVKASVKFSDPDNDPVTVKWKILMDSGKQPVGGDFQDDEADYPDAIVSSSAGNAVIKIPESGGGYRIFAYAYDGKGHAATANSPIKVDGEVLPEKLKPVKLPFVIYDDAGGKQPYIPSGYMGNTGAINMEMDCAEKPYKGSTCIKVTYSANDNWGGVAWQSPANDWGKVPGGFNITGASDLEFRVRGEKGSEVVSFSFGILKNVPFPDSDNAEIKNVKMKTEWQKVRIPLDTRDLSCIKTGFSWSLAGSGQPVTFYLDEIRFVGDE